MIAIIDYGMGNLASVYNAFKKVGVEEEVLITSNPDDVRAADKAILPGVGAFGDAIHNLDKFNLVNIILDFVKSGKPFLGICLGMHLLFEKGYENGIHDGLGVFKGEVKRFDIKLPVPHIGWNTSKITKKTALFDNLKDNAYFYFDHAYYPIPEEDVIAMRTDYGIDYVSGVLRDNVSALQFHPEKSHNNGLRIIENFSKSK